MPTPLETHPKQQHYVPRFLIRNFASTSSRRCTNAFVLSKGESIPNASIAGQAQKHRLYGIEGGESTLAQIDSAAASVLNELGNTLSSPKIGSFEHNAIILFIMMQIMRVPATIDSLINQFEDMADQADRHRWHEAEKQLRALSSRIEDAITPALSVSLAAMSLPLGLDLEVRLLVNRSGTPYILGDHPACFYNMLAEHRSKWCSGFAIPNCGVQVFLPYSPSLCVLVYDPQSYVFGGRRRRSVIEIAEAGVIAKINKLQIVNAHACVFHHSMQDAASIAAWASAVMRARDIPRHPVQSVSRHSRSSHERNVLLFHSTVRFIRLGLSIAGIRISPKAHGFVTVDGHVGMRDPMLVNLVACFVYRVISGHTSHKDFFDWAASLSGEELKAAASMWNYA